MPSSFAPPRRARRSPRSSRAPGRPRRGRRARCRSPRGCPGRSACRPRARCSGPCGSCGRSGGSAGGRRRRSRARRAAGAPSRTPAKPPQERGKSSYQAPKRASRGRRRPRSVADARLLGAVACRGGERRLDGRALVAEQHGALRQLAGEILLARRRPCGAARPGTTRPGRPTPRRGSTSGRGRSTSNEPAQTVVAERLERRLLQRLAPGGLVADRGAELLVAVAEDPAP